MGSYVVMIIPRIVLHVPKAMHQGFPLQKYSVKALLAGAAAIGTTVRVQGWLRSRRTSKGGFSFLTIHDGSAFAGMQILAPDGLANYADITDLGPGCALDVRGQLRASPGADQDFEIHADAVDIVGRVLDPQTYPIAKKRHSFEYLRTVAHLRPRTNTFGAIARLRNTLAQAIHHYLHQQGYIWVQTPIITASDCEGAGNLFKVSALDLANLPRTAAGDVDFQQDFFGQQTFLSVSGQLQVESYCLALSKVYTFGPTFRAENSNTSRHLAEFWMVEPELAFADLGDNMNLAESLLKFLARIVLEERQDDMKFFAQHIDKECILRLENLAEATFECMEYDEAIRILASAGQKFEFPVSWGLDLQSEHERHLVERIAGRPLIVINYPKEIKAFYMRQNDDGKTVAAMDVLLPGVGEIIGGSQREERLDVLATRLQEMGLSDELDWYQDLRRYGTVPHAGFGLGLERLVQSFSGMQNIRDVIPFPRTPHNARF